MKRLVIVACLLAAVQSASANGFMGVRDFPTMPCGQFLKMPSDIQDAWAAGFYVGVTGSAAAVGSWNVMVDDIVAGGPSFADVLRKYCAAHLSSTVWHVSEEVIRAAAGLPPLPHFPKPSNRQ